MMITYVDRLLLLPIVQDNWIGHDGEGRNEEVDTDLLVSIVTELHLDLAVQVPLGRGESNKSGEKEKLKRVHFDSI